MKKTFFFQAKKPASRKSNSVLASDALTWSLATDKTKKRPPKRRTTPSGEFPAIQISLRCIMR